MKIIVMGGSFNPPTLAHLALLTSALDQLEGDLGIFLPSSFQYVEKKMAKSDRGDFVLPDKLRFDMLSAMAKQDKRLIADDTLLYGRVEEYTYQTMVRLQEKYPQANLYFLAGNDKVEIFPRWGYIDSFLDRFNIVVCKRDGKDPASLIASHPFLKQYQEKFKIILSPDGIDGISSTAIRRGLEEGRMEVLSYCHPVVGEMLIKHLTSLKVLQI